MRSAPAKEVLRATERGREGGPAAVLVAKKDGRGKEIVMKTIERSVEVNVPIRTAYNLERFKTFIEQRGTESGAWRGEIHDPPTG